jgi:hypothetical protein
MSIDEATVIEVQSHEQQFPGSTTTPEFQSFPRMPRLCRDVIITEKIDGTNAQICISEDGSQIYAGSRNRWITPENDNFGFARWVQSHRTELLTLGPGRHFGEWWGCGIQRTYRLKEKRFSLFNVSRWSCGAPGCTGEILPACCSVVPVLYTGPFDNLRIKVVMGDLELYGSRAAPGFDKPEGIVVYHTAARQYFKKTFEHDNTGKPE